MKIRAKMTVKGKRELEISLTKCQNTAGNAKHLTHSELQIMS